MRPARTDGSQQGRGRAEEIGGASWLRALHERESRRRLGSRHVPAPAAQVGQQGQTLCGPSPSLRRTGLPRRGRDGLRAGHLGQMIGKPWRSDQLAGDQVDPRHEEAVEAIDDSDAVQIGELQEQLREEFATGIVVERVDHHEHRRHVARCLPLDELHRLQCCGPDGACCNHNEHRVDACPRGEDRVAARGDFFNAVAEPGEIRGQFFPHDLVGVCHHGDLLTGAGGSLKQDLDHAAGATVGRIATGLGKGPRRLKLQRGVGHRQRSQQGCPHRGGEGSGHLGSGLFLGRPLARRRVTSRLVFGRFGNRVGMSCRDRPGRPGSCGEHAT